jgi:hypothetical protein
MPRGEFVDQAAAEDSLICQARARLHLNECALKTHAVDVDHHHSPASALSKSKSNFWGGTLLENSFGMVKPHCVFASGKPV